MPLRINGGTLLLFAYLWSYGCCGGQLRNLNSLATGLLGLGYVGLWRYRDRFAKELTVSFKLERETAPSSFSWLLTCCFSEGEGRLNPSMAISCTIHDGPFSIPSVCSTNFSQQIDRIRFWMVGSTETYCISFLVPVFWHWGFCFGYPNFSGNTGVFHRSLPSSFSAVCAGRITSTLAGADFHPPFRLFPLALSYGLFGVNNFASRISGVICLALGATLLFPRGSGDVELRC